MFNIQGNRFLAILFSLLLTSCSSAYNDNKENALWSEMPANGSVTARHEAGLIAINNDIYLIGGRRINPVDVYNVDSNQWQNKQPTPLELHHFQPIVFQEKIYVVGAMTGFYPNEKNLSHILIYNPSTDQWSQGAEIPQQRRRGGAAVSVYNNKFYISGGITQGHMTGTVPWFDVYDPLTDTWEVLADMPHKRDHFQSAIIDNKLYAAGGRITSKLTEQTFELVVNEVDVYDFSTKQWSSTPTSLPTGRAGNTTVAVNGQLWVIGGESGSQVVAHNDVEIFDISKQQWITGKPLNFGRHGSGAVIVNNKLWTISGSGNRGGGPELTSIEYLPLK